MKFLEFPELGQLASVLSSSSQSVKVMARIEPYSCKSVASEKKMFKSLDQEFASDLGSSASPPHHNANLLDSAFGRLDRKDCRKTLWLLIATLNIAYPDHNFSCVKPEDFHKEESAREVLVKMSEALEIAGSSGSNFASSLGALSVSPQSMPARTPEHQLTNADTLAGVHPLIRQILDPVIDLSQCEVFSYCPDPDSDPHAVDSDDESEIESVASSSFATDKHGDIRDILHHSDQMGGETMWEMEGIEDPSLSSGMVSPGQHQTSRHHRFNTWANRSNSRCSVGVLGADSLEEIAMPVNTIQSTPHVAQSYPDQHSSPGLEEESSGGLLWSSHYFFYNRRMKRVLFITIWARSVIVHFSHHSLAALRSSPNTSNSARINQPIRSQGVRTSTENHFKRRYSAASQALNLTVEADASSINSASGRNRPTKRPKKLSKNSKTEGIDRVAYNMDKDSI